MEVSPVHNSDRKIFVEIFVGRGILSRAMVQSGFSVLSVDHENNGAVTPLDMLDLTTSMGVKVLWDILSSPYGVAVHLGLPSGTASQLWAAPVTLSAQHSPEAAAMYNALEREIFHACCHGSLRRKTTAWLGTKGFFSSLAAGHSNLFYDCMTLQPQRRASDPKSTTP